MATEKKNERKHELKDILLFEEDGQYYLKLKYIIEDEHSVKELEIPRVVLPFTDGFPIVKRDFDYKEYDVYYDKVGRLVELPCMNLCTLSTCGTKLNLSKGNTRLSKDVFFTERIIKEKHKEMTLAEIEKKLGYKIKIVAEG